MRANGLQMDLCRCNSGSILLENDAKVVHVKSKVDLWDFHCSICLILVVALKPTKPYELTTTCNEFGANVLCAAKCNMPDERV